MASLPYLYPLGCLNPLSSPSLGPPTAMALCGLKTELATHQGPARRPLNPRAAHPPKKQQMRHVPGYLPPRPCAVGEVRMWKSASWWLAGYEHH